MQPLIPISFAAFVLMAAPGLAGAEWSGAPPMPEKPLNGTVVERTDARLASARSSVRSLPEPSLRQVPFGLADGVCDRGAVVTLAALPAPGLAGGAIGRAMDAADQACIAQVLDQAPDRHQIGWRNGNALYAVRPVDSFRSDEGRECREYQTRAIISGAAYVLNGIACRSPDGLWRMMD
ncbi:hypothetical protein [Telmatospirillum sp. J64-1]|uniref:hypothetical protein n=1 Tax=Telmatospirillum sp. J64-1 TaxID=2502183 RepID=UPI00115E7C08|nr:hypothetical protein [Telmatospirillum sp. J64-1]